jgi:hypothetical protein
MAVMLGHLNQASMRVPGHPSSSPVPSVVVQSPTRARHRWPLRWIFTAIAFAVLGGQPSRVALCLILRNNVGNGTLPANLSRWSISGWVQRGGRVMAAGWVDTQQQQRGRCGASPLHAVPDYLHHTISNRPNPKPADCLESGRPSPTPTCIPTRAIRFTTSSAVSIPAS